MLRMERKDYIVVLLQHRVRSAGCLDRRKLNNL
jgi:hypothetical protein